MLQQVMIWITVISQVYVTLTQLMQYHPWIPFLLGTTWTQQIIHQLLRRGEAGGLYGESVPWLEATASDFLQPREAPSWTLEKINNSSNDNVRYFKTHATVKHLPRGSGEIKGNKDYLFMIGGV